MTRQQIKELACFARLAALIVLVLSCSNNTPTEVNPTHLQGTWPKPQSLVSIDYNAPRFADEAETWLQDYGPALVDELQEPYTYRANGDWNELLIEVTLGPDGSSLREVVLETEGTIDLSDVSIQAIRNTVVPFPATAQVDSVSLELHFHWPSYSAGLSRSPRGKALSLAPEGLR